MSKSLIKSSNNISAMTFISRILGLIRDFVIAKYFGANGYSDSFFIAFRIPNFFRKLFAEGAFSQAFIPILADAKENKTNKEIQDVINHIATRLFVILIIITFLVVILAPIVMLVFAWGLYVKEDQSYYFLASDMLRITFPYLLFISLTALSGAILNVYDNFIVPAFTPVFLNISLIISAIFLAQYLQNPIMALAWGVFIGGFLQLCFQIPFLRKIHRLPKLKFGGHKSINIIKKRILPSLFGASISQINLLIDTMIASTMIAGSVSWLYYSDRLLGLPLALIGVAIATVALTKLSSYFAKKEYKEFRKTIDKSLSYAIILGIPSSIGLVMVSDGLIITLFQYGSFHVTDAFNASLSLSAYGSGLLAFIIAKILVTVFLSRGDTKTPAKVGVVAIISNVVFNLVLGHYYGHTGLAIATSISAVLNSLLLYYFLVKYDIFKFNNSFYKIFIKVVLASIIMSLYIYLMAFDRQQYIDADLISRVLMLAKDIVISVIIYFTSMYIFGVRFKKLWKK